MASSELETEAPPRPEQGKESWTLLAIGFNGMGIIVGLCLMLFGGMRSYQIFDRILVQVLGENVGYVTDLRVVQRDGKRRFGTVIQLEKKGRFPQVKVLVFNERLYQYVKNRYHPPRRLKVTTVRFQRVLSKQAGIAQVGPLRVHSPPKSVEVIVFLGLLVLGGAICFTSLRDLRKRWLRRGLLA